MIAKPKKAELNEDKHDRNNYNNKARDANITRVSLPINNIYLVGILLAHYMCLLVFLG